MKRVDDFRLILGKDSYVPIMLGGMGTDISTSALALEIARLGGIGHISDSCSLGVVDRHFGTTFLRDKGRRFQALRGGTDKSAIRFDAAAIKEAAMLQVGRTMAAKRGTGGIFVNVMEKLTMGAPRETLKARLEGILDAGADGITLSAGLHLSSFDLITDHARFRDAKLGIIVSSARALGLFLRKARRTGRLPDYVVVEGPLAGGHLGYGIDEWRHTTLEDVFAEVRRFLAAEGLAIPLIPAGGIFTGSDAVGFLERGAAAVQVATRFTIAQESGLPDRVKQIYLQAREEDVEVNTQSPTGYPMRMLKSSPALRSNVTPNCEALGFLLDGEGKCKYLDAHARTPRDAATGRTAPVQDKTCLCTHMAGFRVYTCGHYVYRLKDTAREIAPGRYLLPTAEEVFRDYQFGADHRVSRPRQSEAPARSKPRPDPEVCQIRA
ncbi:MAG: nitronate monooxygenase [Candidatus Sericytochromatia bacterium]|nr:nitronate monooxygenase [Candidatus Tanganyikabacteria bacterium]